MPGMPAAAGSSAAEVLVQGQFGQQCWQRHALANVVKLVCFWWAWSLRSLPLHVLVHADGQPVHLVS